MNKLFIFLLITISTIQTTIAQRKFIYLGNQEKLNNYQKYYSAGLMDLYRKDFEKSIVNFYFVLSARFVCVSVRYIFWMCSYYLFVMIIIRSRSTKLIFLIVLYIYLYIYASRPIDGIFDTYTSCPDIIFIQDIPIIMTNENNKKNNNPANIFGVI